MKKISEGYWSMSVKSEEKISKFDKSEKAQIMLGSNFR